MELFELMRVREVLQCRHRLKYTWSSFSFLSRPFSLVLVVFFSLFGTEYYACQLVHFPGCTLFAPKWESSVEGLDRVHLLR